MTYQEGYTYLRDLCLQSYSPYPKLMDSNEKRNSYPQSGQYFKVGPEARSITSLCSYQVDLYCQFVWMSHIYIPFWAVFVALVVVLIAKVMRLTISLWALNSVLSSCSGWADCSTRTWSGLFRCFHPVSGKGGIDCYQCIKNLQYYDY